MGKAPGAARPSPAGSTLPKRAFGRSLSDFVKLSAAERRLVACCARGEICELGEERPEKATVANTIRAGLIRFLALGGDAENPVHEEGVVLWGGWIEGELTLHQAQAAVRLDLRRCYFDTAPVFNMARLPELVLVGSALPGFNADRMAVTGSVFLREGFAASGEVGLIGAQISGTLDCSEGTFSNEGGYALNAQAISVADGVVLRAAKINGIVDLAAAKIGTLVDDADCWEADRHVFDGFHYDRIIGSTDAETRIGWLKQQLPDHLTTDFKPQPWEQLIKVLREMGHPDEAAKVAMAKQDQIRIATAATTRGVSARIKRALHWVYGKGVGYGHRPIWTVYWMMGVCAVFSLAFYAGRETGYFGPTNPLIHASAAFDKCGAPGEGKVFWTSAACPTPPEYTTFQPLLYSLDLILPLVDLHQEADWAPLVVNPAGETLWPGRILRWMMWFEILFGWVASLTLVAVLGRLVDKD
jgi:hypothetical protein